MIWCFKGFLPEAFDFLYLTEFNKIMSDISIIDETTLWLIFALLCSVGLSFFIFVYHIILAYIKSKREKIRYRDTRSFGYILGGAVIISLDFFCILFQGIMRDGMDYGVEAELLIIMLLLSPVIIGLTGFLYNKSKKL